MLICTYIRMHVYVYYVCVCVCVCVRACVCLCLCSSSCVAAPPFTVDKCSRIGSTVWNHPVHSTWGLLRDADTLCSVSHPHTGALVGCRSDRSLRTSQLEALLCTHITWCLVWSRSLSRIQLWVFPFPT